MWNRACPLCFARVPQGLALARSNDLVCPSCHSELELSRPSRVSAALAGLIVAFIAARWVIEGNAFSGWALGVLAAVLGYAAGSVAALSFLSDLVVRPKEAAAFPHAHK